MSSGIKGIRSFVAALAVILALAGLPVEAQQQFVAAQTTEAVPQFRQFSFKVDPPARPEQTNFCSISTANSAEGPRGPVNSFIGSIQVAVQNNLTGIVSFSPGQSGGSLVLANQSATTPGLQIQNSTTSATLQYTASGYTSTQVDVYYNLLVNGVQSCSFGVRLYTDLSTATSIDATSTPSITLTAYTAPDSDPRRECFVNGTSAGDAVQGPLRILVASGETVNVTAPASAPLYVTPSGFSGVAVTTSLNGPINRVSYMQYTGGAGSIPVTVPLTLNSTGTAQGQCYLGVTFVPLGSSAPATAPLAG